MQDEVKVTQAARDAAADYQDHARGYVCSAPLRDGRADNATVVQAFAKFEQDIRHQAERDTLGRMEWRDIESAPRSAHVLINCRRWGVTEAILGDGGWQGATFNGSLIECDPTHWMPLPPAPEAGQ